MKTSILIPFLALMMLMPSVLGLDFSDAQAVELDYNVCDATVGVFFGGVELLSNETSLCEYECDPQVNELVLNGWCYSNGSVINCNASAPAGSGVNSDYWNVSGINTTELLTNASNGQTAFGWGNHAGAGYITDGNTGWNNIYGLVNSTNHTHSQYYLATNPSGFITDGNTGWTNIYGLVNSTNHTHPSIISYNDSAVVNQLQLDIISHNGSIEQRASPGDCPAGYAVMNTTTSGVECVPLVPPSETFNVTSVATSPGSAVGSIAQLNAYDSSTYNVSEAVGGFIVEINYTGITTFDSILMREQYDGGSGHEVLVEIWDYGSSTWEQYYEITDQGSFVVSVIPVFDPSEHIQAGLVQVRFYHAAPGIGSHRLYIDYFVLNKGTSTLSISEHDSLSGRENIATNHPQQNLNNTAQQLQINSKVNGTGTTNTISMFTESNEIGNSLLTQDASGVYVDGGYAGQGISMYANGSLWLYDDILIRGDILTISTTSANGSIIPSVDNQYDLGASGIRWNDIYSYNTWATYIRGTITGSIMLFDATGLTVTSSTNKVHIRDDAIGTIFNEDNGNFDFQVNGDATNYMIFMDASTEKVGIKTDTPSSILEVNGNLEAEDLLDNDASNFFDGTCTTNQTVTGISSNGTITCSSIDITDGILSYNDSSVVNQLQIDVAAIVSYNDSTVVNTAQSNIATLQGNVTTLNANKANLASPSFTGTITSAGVFNQTLTHGNNATLKTMMDFGNVSIMTNSTHFCIKGQSTVCVET